MQRMKKQEKLTGISSLWNNRDYLLLWSGQLVSSSGTQVSQLAFPLLILALTQSPAMAGFAGALRALPYLIFSLPAGALIDHWDRKRVMIVCDVVRVLALGSISLSLLLGYLTIFQVFAVMILEGTFFVFFNIAEISSLPRIVPKAQLPAAVSQNETTDGITSLIGPSLGGILYSISALVPFLTDALSYTCSCISLCFIKTNLQEKRMIASRNLWIEIGEGLRWLWQQPLIRSIAILTGGINLVSSGSMLIVIILAQNIHTPPLYIGTIFAIGGLGGIVGSILAPSIQRHFTFGLVIIMTCWMMAITTLFYIFAPNWFVLGVITCFSFIIGPIYNVVQLSYRSALIPDELQGRVNSTFRLIAFGGQPIGLALIGFLIQQIGVIETILLCAAFRFLLAILTTLNKEVRNAHKLI
jgi:MFS family permease